MLRLPRRRWIEMDARFFGPSFLVGLASIGIFALVAILMAAPASAQQSPWSPRSAPLPETGLTFWEKSPIGPISYQRGRGVVFGNTGLNVGGFTTAEFDRTEGDSPNIDLDSANLLMLYQPVDVFRVFSEIEIGNLFSHEIGGKTESDPTFTIERLYGELSLGDRLSIRFGKFQTPIGRWNLVPAEPFVWTASDPVMLDAAFDDHQTGLTIGGTFFPRAGSVDYWIYGQILDPIDPSDSPPPTSRSVGGRIQFTRPRREWSVGASFLASMRKKEWTELVGLDAEVHVGRFELLTEAVYERGAIPDRDMAGIFVQGRYEILRGFHLVARYEFFDRLGSKGDDVHIGDLGFAWQPTPWLLLKATYRLSDQETDDVDRGVSSSISVVF